jgi:hypothetical protein
MWGDAAKVRLFSERYGYVKPFRFAGIKIKGLK